MASRRCIGFIVAGRPPVCNGRDEGRGKRDRPSIINHHSSPLPPRPSSLSGARSAYLPSCVAVSIGVQSPPMKPSRKTIGWALLGALALGLRVWVVLALSTEHAGHHAEHGPVTYEHGQIAENLLAGRGFAAEFLGSEGPTSQQAPFYPLLLAAAYRSFGVATPATILFVQLLQCAAGTALVLAVVWLGWVLVPDRPGVGWVAGLGAAVYPTHLYMV